MDKSKRNAANDTDRAFSHLYRNYIAYSATTHRKEMRIYSV